MQFDVENAIEDKIVRSRALTLRLNDYKRTE
jgi:hypothetical protein